VADADVLRALYNGKAKTVQIVSGQDAGFYVVRIHGRVYKDIEPVWIPGPILRRWQRQQKQFSFPSNCSLPVAAAFAPATMLMMVIGAISG